MIDFQNNIVYIQYLFYSLEKVKKGIKNLDLELKRFKREDFILRLKILDQNIAKMKDSLLRYFSEYLENNVVLLQNE